MIAMNPKLLTSVSDKAREANCLRLKQKGFKRGVTLKPGENKRQPRGESWLSRKGSLYESDLLLSPGKGRYSSSSRLARG